MTPIDPLAVAALIAAILDDLGIRYVIGGSVASSVLGEPRSTLDLDVMVEIDIGSAQSLAEKLQHDFYVDGQDVLDSVRSGLPFNAVHKGSSMKVDFFPAEEFAGRQMDRRRALRVRDDLPPLYFYSAEDLVVRKLMWFKAGNETSQRQWRDVIGILKASGSSLDWSYLKMAARDQSVKDLLRRAIGDAGLI